MKKPTYHKSGRTGSGLLRRLSGSLSGSLSVLLLLIIISSVCLSGCLTTDKQKNTGSPDTGHMTSFSSDEELQAYLAKAESSPYAYAAGYGRGTAALKATAFADTAVMMESSAEAPAAVPAPTYSAAQSYDNGNEAGGNDVERYSGTNTRTEFVDEADIIKTDGNYIYYKSDNWYYVRDQNGRYQDFRKTYIIDALPPEEAAIVSAIEDDMYITGLYLVNDSLIMVGSSEIKCYDVKDPENPSLRWSEDTDGYYENSRLIDDTLYLVTSKYRVSYPVRYLDTKIAADRVFAPAVPGVFSSDISMTHYLTKIDLSDGLVKDTVAVLGNYDTVLYVNSKNAYLTSHYIPDEQKASINFLRENGSRYFPDDVMDKVIRVLDNDDFGDRAKYIEIDETIEAYFSTLSDDDAEEISERIDEDFNEYYSDLLLEKEFSLITRVNLDTFDVTSGSMPGKLLNDYALDEYDGNLRTASTIGNSWRTRNDSSSIVTVFDEDMAVIGSLTDIGKGERIYSAVFTGETLYLVTFRETDPFFVIDLSDPESPSVSGELKIPGYSSYLRPIGNDLVIGIGMINGSSKISLFDVADPAEPKEIDSFVLDEYTSAVYDFHAFLWDSDNNILVLPAGRHAYIFSVTENGIDLLKDDEHGDEERYDYVTRALYINDCLYTVASESIHVIDMDTWETINVIEIPPSVYPDWDIYYYDLYEEPIEPVEPVKA